MPEEMRAWKPETAPQAMVMKQKGKILPAKTGPGAVDEVRERRHLDGRAHEDDARGQGEDRRRS